jgi:hypothetical protein
MDIDARAFGQLEGQVLALTTMMASQSKTLADQNDVLARLNVKIDLLSNTMSEAKGGWRTVMWLTGVAASLGGFATWFATHIPFSR